MAAKKRCSPNKGCGKLKDIETGFYVDKAGNVPSLCRECMKKRRKAYYSNHKDAEKKRVMEYFDKHKKKLREQQKEYYHNRADKLKAKALKRYHAIKKTERKVVAKSAPKAQKA